MPSVNASINWLSNPTFYIEHLHSTYVGLTEIIQEKNLAEIDNENNSFAEAYPLIECMKLA